MRKSDPTDYTLRVKMGADYYLYNGQASYGDKLEVIAIIDVLMHLLLEQGWRKKLVCTNNFVNK